MDDRFLDLRNFRAAERFEVDVTMISTEVEMPEGMSRPLGQVAQAILGLAMLREFAEGGPAEQVAELYQMREVAFEEIRALTTPEIQKKVDDAIKKIETTVELMIKTEVEERKIDSAIRVWRNNPRRIAFEIEDGRYPPADNFGSWTDPLCFSSLINRLRMGIRWIDVLSHPEKRELLLEAWMLIRDGRDEDGKPAPLRSLQHAAEFPHLAHRLNEVTDCELVAAMRNAQVILRKLRSIVDPLEGLLLLDDRGS